MILATTVAMIGTDPHGPVEGTAAAATRLALVALVALVVFLVRYGRLRDGSPQRAGLAEAPMRVDPHPAFTEPASRNPRSAERLRVGRMRTRRGRYRGQPRARPR
ncbi:hypothetical protein OG321_38660 [Streptomyces sp. NBC_00424]|uniref:hypothetical protein n=1 Tax=Streptomyces sp. NBC_00424 TaxID=2903648 RepID=UPI0022583096|nr:hypothetical protein [Streptomyces sp. NBC_00424]MCX5078369.1 hypothetical protein [Streptomyces sp. NBC_00424]